MRTAILVAVMLASPVAWGGGDMLSPPHPLRPVNNAEVGGSDLHFLWEPSTALQGESLRYELEVWRGLPEAKDATRLAQASIGDGQGGAIVGGLPFAALSWRVRAVTSDGRESGWSTSATFTTVDTVRTTVGSHVDDQPERGCGIGRRTVRPGLVVALLVLAAVLIYRRRSS